MSRARSSRSACAGNARRKHCAACPMPRSARSIRPFAERIPRRMCSPFLRRRISAALKHQTGPVFPRRRGARLRNRRQRSRWNKRSPCFTTRPISWCMASCILPASIMAADADAERMEAAERLILGKFGIPRPLWRRIRAPAFNLTLISTDELKKLCLHNSGLIRGNRKHRQAGCSAWRPIWGLRARQACAKLWKARSARRSEEEDKSLSPQERAMLLNVLGFGETRVAEVMIPARRYRRDRGGPACRGSFCLVRRGRTLARAGFP